MNKLHVGDKIELTEEASSYTTLPKGLRGTITAISSAHATMNGGGFDVSFTIDDVALAGEIGEAITSRCRELQARDPEFYTDRYIAYVASHPKAHSDRIVVVTDTGSGEIAGSTGSLAGEIAGSNAGSSAGSPEGELTGALARDIEAALENMSDGGGTLAEHAALLAKDHGLSEDEATDELIAGSNAGFVVNEYPVVKNAGSLTNDQIDALATGSPAERLADCKAAGSHIIVADDNNWCATCDTGECPDCDEPTTWVEDDGWYRHIDPKAQACFLIQTASPYAEAREAFQKAVTDFIDAGNRMVDAWDANGFHADESYPLPERLAPPMSFDEWFAELSEHYARIEA